MTNTLGFAHFYSHLDKVGLAVLGLLLLASVISWALILLKSGQLIKLYRESRESTAWLEALEQPATLEQQVQHQRDRHCHATLVSQALRVQERLSEHLRRHGELSEQTQQQMVSSAFRRALLPLQQQLDQGQTLLATIASSAPFVGLLGTVWGIYHALVAIGQSGQSSLDKVAGPVGEALIMTGLGLAVAIPAAVAYNLIGQAARIRGAHLRDFAAQVFERLAAWPTGASTIGRPSGRAPSSARSGLSSQTPTASGVPA